MDDFRILTNIIKSDINNNRNTRNAYSRFRSISNINYKEYIKIYPESYNWLLREELLFTRKIPSFYDKNKRVDRYIYDELVRLECDELPKLQYNKKYNLQEKYNLCLIEQLIIHNIIGWNTELVGVNNNSIILIEFLLYMCRIEDYVNNNSIILDIFELIKDEIEYTSHIKTQIYYCSDSIYEFFIDKL